MHQPNLDQAQKNYNFLELIKKSSNGDYLDWQITVMFYIAKHLMIAFLSNKKCPNIPLDHFQFNKTLDPRVKRKPSFSISHPAYVGYIELYNHSRTVRYLESDYVETDLPEYHSQSEQALQEVIKFAKKHGLSIN